MVFFVTCLSEWQEQELLLSGFYAAALEDLGLLAPLAAILLVCHGDKEVDMRPSGALLRELPGSFHIGFALEARGDRRHLQGRARGTMHSLQE
jgi:hypothetical protein